MELLLRYLGDPDLRKKRELEITNHFDPRSWQRVADDLLRSTRALVRQIRPSKTVAAMSLPPNQYLPITSDPAALSLSGMDGSLSADLICISGWRAPEVSGVYAVEPEAMLRFRAEVPVGTRIYVILRLAAPNGSRHRLRILSECGAQTEMTLGGSTDAPPLSCMVGPDNLVTFHLSVLDTPRTNTASQDWSLKGILYLASDRLADKIDVAKSANSPRFATSPKLLDSTGGPRSRDESIQPHVLLRPSPPMDDDCRAPTFGAFLQSTNSYWSSSFTAFRDEPIFYDQADREIFHSKYRNEKIAPVGTIADRIRLVRRSDQFISMARFTEGLVFDRAGVSRAFGYLQGAPQRASWVLKDVHGISACEEALASAPYYDKSFLIFYNGNLHNYYHWMAEGVLSLDVLSQAIGSDQNMSIALPKSMDINALFDHRGAIRAVGLDGFHIMEMPFELIRVKEAIWVDSELIEDMPAPYLQEFRQRVAARSAGLRGQRNRRLLVARKGPTRKIHNLGQVQEFLSQHNFDTVYLEGMSVIDQIVLFQSAEFVIGVHGAGLTNLLFCEAGTKVIEFMPSVEMRPFFWLISAKLNLIHAVQFCSSIGGQDFRADISVDIGKLKAIYRMVDS
jgi:hypothetical protein